MIYDKTVWVAEKTLLSSSNLNKIEDAIEQVGNETEKLIEENELLKKQLNDLQTNEKYRSYVYTNIELAQWETSAIPEYPYMCTVNVKGIYPEDTVIPIYNFSEENSGNYSRKTASQKDFIIFYSKANIKITLPKIIIIK